MDDDIKLKPRGLKMSIPCSVHNSNPTPLPSLPTLTFFVKEPSPDSIPHMVIFHGCKDDRPDPYSLF